jgi:hypothetical protein
MAAQNQTKEKESVGDAMRHCSCIEGQDIAGGKTKSKEREAARNGHISL